MDIEYLLHFLEKKNNTGFKQGMGTMKNLGLKELRK